MAQLVVAATGAVIGFYMGGPAGAQAGWAIGSMVGAGLTPAQKTQGPRIADLRVMGTEYGQPIPYVQAHPVVAGQIIWASARREIATTTEQGGKGGPSAEVTTYTYEVDLLVMVSDNEIAGVSRIWSNGKLVYNVNGSASAIGTTPSAFQATVATLVASAGGGRATWSRMTVYTGASAQLPDPTYEAAVGAGNAPAYRHRGTVFIESLNLGSSGQIPNLTFEVFTSGTPPGVGYSDKFMDGLTPYSVVTGSAVYFSTETTDWGGGIVCAARINDPTDDIVARSITAVTSEEVYVKFRIDSAFADDAAILGFTNAAGTFQWAFNPRREAAFDALQRPSIGLNGAGVTIGGAALTVGVWYQLYAKIVAGSGNSTVLITTAYDGATVISQTVSGSYTPFTAEKVRFYVNNTAGASTSGATYADLQILPSRATVANETVQNVVSRLCLRAGLTAGQIDVTALSSISTPVRALAVSQAGPTRSVLEMLAAAYFFDAVLSDKLYFRPRGAASVATIPWADLGASADADGDPQPLVLKPANDLEVPAAVSVRYMNVDTDCAVDVQVSDRLVSTARTISTVELPLGFTAAEAKAVADVMVMDATTAALSTRISLLNTYARLEPTDPVVVTAEDGSTFRLRLVKLADSRGVREFDAVLDDQSVLTSAGVTSTAYTPSTTVNGPPDTILELMDTAILRDADNEGGYYAAAKGASTPWGGCVVYSSRDDVDYQRLDAINEAAVTGTCSTTLATWSGANVFDEVNSLTVNVGAGTLTSDTRTNVLDASANAALVGSEIIQFRTATLVTAGIYTLSGLLRGRRGTEWAMTGHAASERFVLLRMTGLRRITVETDQIGSLRYVKGITYARTLDSALPQTFTPSAVGLKPLSPVDLRASRDVSTSDITLTWSRRTRLAKNFSSGTVPLGEASEAYEVDIFADGTYAVLKRTLSGLASKTATYTSAQQTTDFGSNQATVYVRIYQRSATVGRGYAGQAAV